MTRCNSQLGRAMLILVLISGICGCGGSDRPVVVPASGIVQLNGKAITTGGSIMFQPENGRHSRAKIQPDGSFTMTTFSKGDGATVGRQMVRVVSTGEEKVDEDGEAIVGPALIPKKYGNFRTSGVEVMIPPEGSDSLVVELEK